MRLSRKQSLILSACVIVGFFAGVSLLHKTAPSQPPEELPQKKTIADRISKATQKALAKLPKAATKLVMDNFHRKETKDGKTLWEIKSKEGYYDPTTQKARLMQARLTFYQKNGDVITVTTQKADVSISEGKLHDVKLSGNIIITLNDLKIITEKATMEGDNQIVIVPNKVIIEQSGLRLEGQKLHANLETREFELIKNVSTTIDPEAAKKLKNTSFVMDKTKDTATKKRRTN